MFENTARVPGTFGCKLERSPTFRSVKLETVASKLPAPEPSWSNIALSIEKLAGQQIQTLYPIDGNDQFGCCTCSGAAHLITLLAALTGKQVIPASQDVVNTYFHLSGGADNGLNLGDVLTYWQQSGFIGDKISAHVEIDPTNWRLCQQAIQFFGGLYIGFKVQRNAQQDFNNGQPWTPGKLTGEGHCVVVTDSNADGSGVCLTWGNKQAFTQAWWAECVDEVHAVVSPYATVFDAETLANLQSDLGTLGT